MFFKSAKSGNNKKLYEKIIMYFCEIYFMQGCIPKIFVFYRNKVEPVGGNKNLFQFTYYNKEILNAFNCQLPNTIAFV